MVLCSASHFSISKVSNAISSFVFRSFEPENTSCSNTLQYSLYWLLLAITLYLSVSMFLYFNNHLHCIVQLRCKVCHIPHVCLASKQINALAYLRKHTFQSSCTCCHQYQILLCLNHFQVNQYLEK